MASKKKTTFFEDEMSGRRYDWSDGKRVGSGNTDSASVSERKKFENNPSSIMKPSTQKGKSKMASSKADKAYSMRMAKQAIKKVANDKPSQFKKKGDFKPGGTFSTGRAIKAQPDTRGPKKAGKGAVASKGQAMRKADAADASKRRKSGTTRSGKMY